MTRKSRLHVDGSGRFSLLKCATMHSINQNAATDFRLAVRVYYEDTDAAGIVYYASYLRFLERARTEWLRSIGFEQSQLAREHGIAFAARSIEADYLKAGRLDDLLTVVSEIDSLGGAQLTFAQRVEREDELLFTAKMRVACVDVVRMKPIAIPRQIRQRFQALKGD